MIINFDAKRKRFPHAEDILLIRIFEGEEEI